MQWLIRGWDRFHLIALAVGLAAGATLVLHGLSGFGEAAGAAVAVGARWSMWQIPPPGRSLAPGRPADGWARLGRLAVAVLLATFALDAATAPLR